MLLSESLKSNLLIVLVFLLGSISYGQIVAGNAYMMGDVLNVAIDGPRGKEGTFEGAGFHHRGGGGATACGIVADPTGSGWAPSLFDGDFFTPGTAENGWGIEIAGVNYSNNHDIYEVIVDPLKPITHTVEGDCITVEWEGSAAGVIINVKYHLTKTDLFYTTEVTLTNTTLFDLTDVYYYRNVDPDNNQSIGGSHTTTNTIVSQPSGDCQKALVSATQVSPHPSFMGFGAFGNNFRVSHRGFHNRDGSDIWNGTDGLTGVVDSSVTYDHAISLAYKSYLAAGDSVNFTYVVLIDSDATEAALLNLMYINYESMTEFGGGFNSQCTETIDTVKTCFGNPVTLSVNGPNPEDYSWVWTSTPVDPDMVSDGMTITVNPTETTTYSVTATPISACLTENISRSIVVEYADGPEIYITDPSPSCEEFDITTLVFEDLNEIGATVTYFFSEMPDSATQTSPIFAGPMMDSDDEVWLMIGDTVGGCYHAVMLDIVFIEPRFAGDDSLIALCGTIGTTIDIYDLVSEDAYPSGTLTELTASGAFDDLTHLLEVGDLSGIYEFSYLVESVGDCPEDEALIFVEVYAQPNAELAFESGGNSSEDGFFTTCIDNLVSFEDISTIPLGGVITDWNWDFGDGIVSDLENPSHLYGDFGTYTVILTVSTEDGCASSDSLQLFVVDCLGITQNSSNQIVIYPNPSSDYAIIDFGDALVGDNQLLVHNALGQQVFSKTNITDKQFVLNVNELGKGIYYVSLLESTTEVFVAKLIVQ
jgi:hypothetical protein